MSAGNINLDRKVVFPFYIFLSLLMGYMGVAAVTSVWEAGETIIIVSVIALFATHVGLYWLNVLWVERNNRWVYFYYPAQTAVMVGIVLLLNGRS
ncbi:MAG: hypothetical protein IT315_11715, partial [Anaerolineales bacterium]|nr:hypothetical protein [Anaerolineales bacterium]